MTPASELRQIANIDRERRRDLAAEMAAPMIAYAQRSIDRDIAYLEASIARLGASSLAATTGLSSFGSSRDERVSSVPASIPCAENDR